MTDVNAGPQESPASSPPAAANKAAKPSGANGTSRPGRPGAVADRTAAPPGAAGRWPLSRIIGVALLTLLLFSLAAMVAGGIASAQPARQPPAGDSHARPRRAPGSAARHRAARPGDRRARLRAECPAGLPGPVHQWRDRGAGARSRPCRPSSTSCRVGAAADLESVITQAHYWRVHYAVPTINQVSRTGKPVVSPDILTGKADFDALRGKIGVLQAEISAARAGAVAALNDSATVLDAVFIAVAVGLAAIVVLLALGLRATVIRPLHRLAARSPPGGRRRLRARGQPDRSAGGDQPGRGREQDA